MIKNVILSVLHSLLIPGELVKVGLVHLGYNQVNIANHLESILRQMLKAKISWNPEMVSAMVTRLLGLLVNTPSQHRGRAEQP